MAAAEAAGGPGVDWAADVAAAGRRVRRRPRMLHTKGGSRDYDFKKYKKYTCFSTQNVYFVARAVCVIGSRTPPVCSTLEEGAGRGVGRAGLALDAAERVPVRDERRADAWANQNLGGMQNRFSAYPGKQ